MKKAAKKGCFLFHKWDGCICLKCGKVRETGHQYINNNWDGCTCLKCGKVREIGHRYENNRCTICHRWNPRLACGVCGKTKAQFDADNEELNKRMKAMGVGLFFGSAGGLMVCPECGKVACSKCARELHGHDTKTCPFCGEDYGWGSVI